MGVPAAVLPGSAAGPTPRSLTSEVFLLAALPAALDRQRSGVHTCDYSPYGAGRAGAPRCWSRIPVGLTSEATGDPDDAVSTAPERVATVLESLPPCRRVLERFLDRSIRGVSRRYGGDIANARFCSTVPCGWLPRSTGTGDQARVRKYVDDLLNGRRARPFRADKPRCAAIELRAARATRRRRPTPVDALKRRIAEQLSSDEPERKAPSATRRQVIVGTTAAATAAVVAVSVDHPQ